MNELGGGHGDGHGSVGGGDGLGGIGGGLPGVVVVGVGVVVVGELGQNRVAIRCGCAPREGGLGVRDPAPREGGLGLRASREGGVVSLTWLWVGWCAGTSQAKVVVVVVVWWVVVLVHAQGKVSEL